MIISQMLDAQMRWPGPQLAGQRVATLSGHTGLLGPVRHRGRPLVVGELPSQQTWGRNNLIFSRYTIISLLLSRLGCILCCLASEASEVSEAGFHRHMWAWRRQHRTASGPATYPAWRRQRTQGGTRHHTVLRGQNYLESPPVA